MCSPVVLCVKTIFPFNSLKIFGGGIKSQKVNQLESNRIDKNEDERDELEDAGGY